MLHFTPFLASINELFLKKSIQMYDKNDKFNAKILKFNKIVKYLDGYYFIGSDKMIRFYKAIKNNMKRRV